MGLSKPKIYQLLEIHFTVMIIILPLNTYHNNKLNYVI